VGAYAHQVMGTLGGNLCQENRCRYYNQSAFWRGVRPPCRKAGCSAASCSNSHEVEDGVLSGGTAGIPAVGATESSRLLAGWGTEGQTAAAAAAAAAAGKPQQALPQLVLLVITTAAITSVGDDP
jgi:hypothetical protein